MRPSSAPPTSSGTLREVARRNVARRMEHLAAPFDKAGRAGRVHQCRRQDQDDALQDIRQRHLVLVADYRDRVQAAQLLHALGKQVGLAAQFLASGVVVVDVLVEADELLDVPVLVAHRCAARRHPAIGAVVAAQTHVDLIDRAFLRCRRPGAEQAFPVVGMDRVEPAFAVLLLLTSGRCTPPRRGCAAGGRRYRSSRQTMLETAVISARCRRSTCSRISSASLRSETSVI